MRWDNKEWLERIKVGDLVIECCHRTDRIRRVERLTKTQIILAGTSTRFRRKSGWSVGADTWSQSHLREGTPEAVAKVEEAMRVRKARNFLAALPSLNLSSEEALAAAAAVEKTIVDSRTKEKEGS